MARRGVDGVMKTDRPFGGPPAVEGAGVSRRDFLRGCALGGAGLLAGGAWTCMAEQEAAGAFATIPVTQLKEASYWEAAEQGQTKCNICPHRCVRKPGEVTFCKTRINRGGRLYSLTYGRPCTLCVDPLGKNPLYHVAPGSDAIGVATAGCNLICKYCQNWDISQTGPWKTRNMDVSPRGLVQKAKDRGLKWITFSYTEPVAYLEYALEVGRVARQEGVRVAVATAGYIEEAPLKELMRWSDAFSVTLKGYNDAFYKDVCGADMESVWRSIRAISAAGRWMEVVTLVVPGMNDEIAGLSSLARSLAAVNRDVPMHFLRFAPAYRLSQLQPTPVKTLESAHAAAVQEGLRYVYLDVSGHRLANTYCPRCREVVIERAGFTIVRNGLRKDRCAKCNMTVAGMF